MLYKVTPMLTPAAPEKKARPKVEGEGAVKEPRKRRKSAVYDADGNEVLITMMCLKCRAMKPLTMFGLRKMADGAIRNQPWCRTCRSGASTKKKGEQVEEAVAGEGEVLQVSAAPGTEPAPAEAAEPLAVPAVADAQDPAPA